MSLLHVPGPSPRRTLEYPPLPPLLLSMAFVDLPSLRLSRFLCYRRDATFEGGDNVV